MRSALQSIISPSEIRGSVPSLRLRPGSAERAATRVVLTVDTEPDDAWTDHRNESVRNVQELLKLQKLLNEFGARATLLVTYKVIQDPAARDILLRLVQEHGAEVGAHLHPWETPPFMQDGSDVVHQTFPHELPHEAFLSKLERLTAAITESIAAPTSYRAGRWGIIGPHLTVLERLGYTVDSSVTSWIDWRGTPGVPYHCGGRGGIDFRLAPLEPYHPEYTDVCRSGLARILEVPVTVGFTRAVPPRFQRLYPWLPELAKRALRKSDIMRPVGASPTERSEDLARMIRQIFSEGRRTLNIAMHSSELMTGGSPNSRTSIQTRRIFRHLRMMLETIVATGDCAFSTLRELAASDGPTTPGGPPHAVRTAEWHEPMAQGISIRFRSEGSVRPAQPRARKQISPATWTEPKTRLAYVLAASHSGSTLTAMLMAAHPDACTVGELQMGIRTNIDEYRCSCGTRIRECPFWCELRGRMTRYGEPLEFEQPRTDVRGIESAYVQRLLRPLHRGRPFEIARDAALGLSPSWHRGYSQVQERMALLAREVCAMTRSQVIVDTSKSALRLKYLLRNPALDVRIVRLLRDGRGVALTYYIDEKRIPMRGAAHEWRRSNEEAEALLAGICPSRWIEARYEELCAAPMETLRRLACFLGLDASRASLRYRAKPHHVVGNNMRLQQTSEIVLDDRWRTELSAADLRDFDAVAGSLNRKYGYV